jgi:hypothetical protein
MVGSRLVSAAHRRSLGRATEPGDDFAEAFDGCGEGQDRAIATAVGQSMQGQSAGRNRRTWPRVVVVASV